MKEASDANNGSGSMSIEERSKKGGKAAAKWGREPKLEKVLRVIRKAFAQLE